jgi:N-acetylmuramoyl-L-alanine amidase
VETISPGTHGERVREIQARLLALGFHIEVTEVDAHAFGDGTEAAVRAFQQERGLLVDGLVGPDSWDELVEAGYSLGDRVVYLRLPPVRGDDVRALQRRLNLLGFDPGREDGIFGPNTAGAVRDFQRNVGLRPDGIVGPLTIEALDRLLAAPVSAQGRATVRENERLRAGAATTLDGRTIALDPGHGPTDPGATGPTGLREADAAFEVVRRLADELTLRGALPVPVRPGHLDPDASERADAANRAEADALISIHLNSHDDPAAEGSASYYFGRLGFHSVAGHALAELIQDEVTAATGLRDGRTHPKAFLILRETRMPAVQVEPCFITNPKEEQLLGEEPFLRDLARAIATGLERFFAGRSVALAVDGSAVT